MIVCHHCGKELQEEKISRRDSCPSCGSDMHACLNCRFYSKTASKQCTEPKAEFVKDKEKANFCEWFQPKRERSGATESEKDAARKALDDLFG